MPPFENHAGPEDKTRLLEKTAALLEFHRVREAAASRALSAEAARLIVEEAPLFDAAAVRERKALCAAFHALLAGGEGEKRQELPAAGFLLPRLAVEGMVLDADELLALGLFIERGEELRRFVLAGTERPGGGLSGGALSGGSGLSGGGAFSGGGEGLRRAAEAAPDCSSLARDIFGVLDRDGQVRDLPEIKQIRRRIQELMKDLERIAGRCREDENTRRMLQSELPSQRDGRLVLAVKANFRGRIKGIVHEVSSTGQTIFVEPEESVEKNNQILLEKAALAEAVRRLLRRLTGALAGRLSDLETFHRIIVYLESLRARARYSLEQGGVFAAEGPLFLKGARHPLLGPGAVPIDLRLDSRDRMVIITGPNTGGKTAALKTAGLFALMNQSGLALPAPEASLPVFDGVYADIGDEQSLSQSLSTFSAHMTNIAAIIAAAGGHSLVLLDELGAGTDPEEGSAIAMSILDHFIETKSTVILTTHHGMLKNYGYGREGVENASVEFDRRTLSPTYRIIMGIPGESRALDIAARNGFPPALVERARSYLDEERSDVSALIAGLKEKSRELDEASRGAREAAALLREDRRKADLRELTLRQRERLLKQEGAGEFRALLLESRKSLENLVREIREGEMNREKPLKVKEFIRDLETKSAAVDAALEAEDAALEALAEGAALTADYGDGPGSGGGPGPGRGGDFLVPGAEVLAGPSRRRGRLVRPDKNGAWVVETGSVKMCFPARELRPLDAAAPGPAGSAAPGNRGGASGWDADLAPAEAKMEISLRGLRLEEALEALRRQIDAAVLAGLGEFAVIHGKGGGVLQQGVQEYLRNDPAVAEFHFSRPELGGFGRTEVILKR